MELWIRSQDKKQLLKVNDGLFIANGFTDTDDSFIGIKNVGHVGRYKTEKRALEILDEIQDELISSDFMPIEKKEEVVLTCGSARIYEMPEE